MTAISRVSDTGPSGVRPTFAPPNACGDALAVPGPTELLTIAGGCDSSAVTSVAGATYRALI